MYVTDALADSYHHHFGQQMPNVSRESLRDYVRQQEQRDPEQVIAMSEYLLKNVYEGARLPDGSVETRDTWEKAMGVDVLRSYVEQGDFSRGISRGVQGVKSRVGAAIEGVGQVTGIEGVEQFGEGLEADAEAELKRIRPGKGITQVQSLAGLREWVVGTLGQGAIDLGYTGGGALAGAGLFGVLGLAIAGPPGAVVGAKAGSWIGGLAANFPLFYGRTCRRSRKNRRNGASRNP